MKAFLAEYKAFVLLAALLACFGLGIWVGDSIASAETAKQAKTFAEEKQVAVEAVLTKLVTAQANEREALNRLATAKAEHEKISLEKDHEIRRLTTGRPCLSASVVRVLNQPDNVLPGAVPAAVAGNDAEDAGFASDTDVALWSRGARSKYNECRGYLGELRRYYEDLRRE
jgi:prophage endopeptidase